MEKKKVLVGVRLPTETDKKLEEFAKKTPEMNKALVVSAAVQHFIEAPVEKQTEILSNFLLRDLKAKAHK